MLTVYKRGSALGMPVVVGSIVARMNHYSLGGELFNGKLEDREWSEVRGLMVDGSTSIVAFEPLLTVPVLPSAPEGIMAQA